MIDVSECYITCGRCGKRNDIDLLRIVNKKKYCVIEIFSRNCSCHYMTMVYELFKPLVELPRISVDIIRDYADMSHNYSHIFSDYTDPDIMLNAIKLDMPEDCYMVFK